MKIAFENVGIINKIELDLSKKLTIFCGQNGTGKTYACYLVYGYIQQATKSYKPLFDFNDFLDKGHINVELDYDNLYDLAKKYAKLDSTYIQNIFGVKNADQFLKSSSKLTSSKDDFIGELRKSGIEGQISVSPFRISLKKKTNEDCINLHLDNIDKVGDFDKIIKFVSIVTNGYINKILSCNMLHDVHILPVERNSIYTFIDELAAKQIENLGLDFIVDDNTNKINRYPSPITKALTIAADLRYTKRKQSEYNWLAEEIEKDILQGNILISKDGALQFSSQKAPNTPLSIHLSASIIKNLSGLVIYLKHLAKKNDLLIIDEPELGLHPDNQILLARVIAKLINSGIRILISTHSDYIIRELNNLIIISSPKISKDIIDNYDYKEEHKINPKDVGVYLFDFEENDTDRVNVKSLSIEESGFEVSLIEDTVSRLADKSTTLYYEIMREDDE